VPAEMLQIRLYNDAALKKLSKKAKDSSFDPYHDQATVRKKK